MKTKLKAKVVKVYFNLPTTSNYAHLGIFTTTKRAIKYMKHLTKKCNKRDKVDPWNIPLVNFDDYSFRNGFISVEKYKELRSNGK